MEILTNEGRRQPWESKKINTSDNPRLVDTRTHQLTGSVGSGKTDIPIASAIKFPADLLAEMKRDRRLRAVEA